MTTLLHKTYPRTLHHLPPGARTVWLFEDSAARAAAGAQSGITVMSAYKTLLTTIRERDLLAHETRLTIDYPVIDGDDPLRFRLECYPLPDLYPNCTIRFRAKPTAPGTRRPAYTLHYSDGTQEHIPIPVRWRRTPDGRNILAACGWVEFSDGSNAPMLTDYEQIYLDSCALMAEHPFPPLTADQPRGPFFERLQLDIRLPARDETLGIGDEHLSLAEALHEDLYFSGLDIFRARLHLPPGDRSLTPGQILPLVKSAPADADHLELHIHLPDPRQTPDAHNAHCPDLSRAGHWPGSKDITAHLAKLGGEPFPGTSRQGRTIPATLIRGQHPGALAISAGQHANETSGIIGALRAAHTLKRQGRISFTLRPLGNPDGYAAFAELSREHPNHMQHAARYTASGCDLAYGEGYENALCHSAREKLPDAWLHINLHGYPAHEWTVPQSGYVPQGFARWTIPKGYFLICRHHPGWENRAHALMQHLLATLAAFDAQMQQNRAMLKRYRAIVGGYDFALAHDSIPYTIETREDGDYPVEIITEAPDETTYGKTFRLAHESHTRIILAAAQFVLDNPEL